MQPSHNPVQYFWPLYISYSEQTYICKQQCTQLAYNLGQVGEANLCYRWKSDVHISVLLVKHVIKQMVRGRLCRVIVVWSAM